MKILIISLLIGAWAGVKPDVPDTIDLVYCYQRINEHYPLARKIELQKKITDLQVRVARTGYYPQLELGGTASYQSEVTDIPAGPEGMNFSSLSKDQYKVSLDISQPVYTGGAVGFRKDLAREQGRQEQLSAEVQLQELREQIDQVYFNILLAQQQARTIGLLTENLETQLETIKAKVKSGVLLPSQQYILQAELIQARQDSIETQSNIQAGYRVLGELIGQEIPAGTVLKIPQISYEKLTAIRPERPELSLFESSRNALEYQKSLENSQKLPSVSVFGSLAYGRPGYNFFNNDFHEFYMVGARVRWNFLDWKNSSDEAKILAIQQQKIEEDRQAFTRQLAAALDQIEEQIISLREQIRRDKKIIELRNSIVRETSSQLKNGVLTATEYITELNQANQAQLALYAHRIQLIRMKIQYTTAKGIPVSRLNESESTKSEEK